MILETSHDPEKVNFNFCSHGLSNDEKLLPCKGLKLSISAKRLDYADHMLHFELLFRVINETEMPNEDKDFIKTGPLTKRDLGAWPPGFMTSYFARNVFLEIHVCVIFQGMQKLIGPSTTIIFLGTLKN